MDANRDANASDHNISEIRGVEGGKICFLRDNPVALVLTLPISQRTLELNV